MWKQAASPPPSQVLVTVVDVMYKYGSCVWMLGCDALWVCVELQCFGQGGHRCTTIDQSLYVLCVSVCSAFCTGYCDVNVDSVHVLLDSKEEEGFIFTTTFTLLIYRLALKEHRLTQ